MIALLLALGCGRPCPDGTTADPARAAEIEERLLLSASAREGLAGRAPARICFVAGARSTLSADGVVRLDERLDLDAAAARAAHLRLHLGEPAFSFDAEEPCEPQVAAALRAEARAFDLELRVARDLGASVAVPFAEDWTADARVDVIERWLVANPGGGGGVEALGDDYARRCASSR